MDHLCGNNGAKFLIYDVRFTIYDVQCTIYDLSSRCQLQIVPRTFKIVNLSYDLRFI
jgi:hypothetical protein